MPLKYCILLFAILALFTSCEEVVYTPKPRGYPKINFPEKGTKQFTEDYCGFTFQYPAYAQVIQDKDFFDQEPEHPCWFDLYIPEFDSRLHCNYVEVGKNKTFDEIKEDAFQLANWHNKRASYIDELPINNNYGAIGLSFEFEGPAASPFQFFVTDAEKKHFFRASLYFNTEVRPDSIRPVYDFVKADLDQMIATFEWKD